MNAHPDANHLVIRGHVHLSLHAVARCFDVHLAWLEQVHDAGLLGRCEVVGDQIAVAATQLDRVACIIRLHFHLGVELGGIELFLAGAERIDEGPPQ